MFLFTFGTFVSQAQNVIDLHTGMSKEGESSTIPYRDVVELEDGYLITYTFDKALILKDNLFPGTSFWKMEGFGMNQIQGEPCTLFRNDLIAIPFGYSAKVEVTDSAYHDFSYELTPARQPLLNSNNEIYTQQNVLPVKSFSGYKPSRIVYQEGVQSYRGHDICQTVVSPIQYNYDTKTVRAYTSITYKVTFVSNSAEASLSRRLPAHLSIEDNFLANNVIGNVCNGDDEIEYYSENQSDVQDYLILSTNAYSEAVNQFAEWKRLLGFNVHVVFRDDWTSTLVANTVADAYANCPALYYLLIVGDHSDVPAKQSSLFDSHITDNHYACIDDDNVPDIYSGRISVSSSDEAIAVINKIIGYEQAPPTNPAFYTNALHCAYFQDENYDGYADRRFAQTSEDVRTYVMLQGKSIQRVYKTPSNVTPLYWNNTSYSNGESIPNELKKPGFAWNGNSTNINNAINSGVFYVLHRDHGSINSWGSPQYTKQNISSLSNGNLLPVVFSMNCLTGKFNENCFAEVFLRKSNGGCVGIYGATEVSYSGYNDVLTTGMFDAIWPNPGLHINIPNRNNTFSVTPTPSYTLGQILAQGMIRLSETYGMSSDHVKYTREIFHCFGDPSMKIYTQFPTVFNNVNISRTESAIFVNTGENENARITAYDPISGEVMSHLGNSAIITISNPNDAIVCVSNHNRIPFIQYPDVMYIQNTNIAGRLDETHDIIKVGNHVTTTISSGDVTTSNADITLRARKVLLDKGTYISIGSSLKIVNP